MSRVYVGNLPMDVKQKDLEDIFYKYGKITDMQIKTPERPPAFGFVTFDDPRDADEAVRARYLHRCKQSTVCTWVLVLFCSTFW